MAASKTGGATIELQEASKRHLDEQLKLIKIQFPELTFKMIVKLLFDIKFLAQNKLKRDGHIKTSRLRNSLFVKTLNQKYAKTADNSEQYNDIEGKAYIRELDVDLANNEGAVGTNVEYAGAIEFGYGRREITAKNPKGMMTKIAGKWAFFGKSFIHPGFKGDSFLYWASKNVDVQKRVSELSHELLGDLTKQGRKNL